MEHEFPLKLPASLSPSFNVAGWGSLLKRTLFRDQFSLLFVNVCFIGCIAVIAVVLEEECDNIVGVIRCSTEAQKLASGKL